MVQATTAKTHPIMKKKTNSVMHFTDSEIMEMLEETDKIHVTTPKEEFILVKKSKYMATLDFIENMCHILILGAVIAVAIIIAL